MVTPNSNLRYLSDDTPVNRQALEQVHHNHYHHRRRHRAATNTAGITATITTTITTIAGPITTTTAPPSLLLSQEEPDFLEKRGYEMLSYWQKKFMTTLKAHARGKVGRAGWVSGKERSADRQYAWVVCHRQTEPNLAISLVPKFMLNVNLFVD